MFFFIMMQMMMMMMMKQDNGDDDDLYFIFILSLITLILIKFNCYQCLLLGMEVCLFNRQSPSNRDG